MTTDAINAFLESLHRLHRISIRLYAGGELSSLTGVQPARAEVAAAEDSFILSALKNSPSSARLVNFGTDMLMAAIIPCACGMHIALGPVRTNILKDEYVRRMLSYVADSTPGMAQSIYEYLKTLPVFSQNQLADLADVISTAINGVPSGISGNAPLPSAAENTSAAYFADQYLQSADISRLYEDERRILFMVKNGLTARIKPLLTAHNPVFGTLRSAQNDLLTLTSLAARTAISAGADPAQCLHMASAYSDRTELCMDYAAVAALREKMLLEYARLASSLEIHGSENPIIRRTVRHVSENITRKISCAEIARSMGVSRTYLSTCFTQETGMTLTEYINRRKVAAAKELLLFTDMPLSAIAQHLSFSSQPYFQNVFKKITSKTPAEYRACASGEDFT